MGPYTWHGIYEVTRPLLYAENFIPGLYGAPDHGQTDLLVLLGVNKLREAKNLPPLQMDYRLRIAAEGHADEMALYDKLDHYGLKNRRETWADRCLKAGFPGASLMSIGENVAGWQISAEQAVSDWTKSPGHYRTMLGDWTHIGSASATSSSGRSYWCCNFGRLPSA